MNRRARSTKTRRRVTVAAALLAGLALLLAACTGSTSSGSTGSPDKGASAGSTSAVAYSACMRAHGVPSFPDPDSPGRLPKTSAQQLGVSAPVFQTAQQSCQHLLPSAGSFQQQFQQCALAGDCPQALVQQALTRQRVFARCMRTHGVPNFPDPTIGPNGAPYSPGSRAGLTHADTHSAPFTSKVNECQHVVGAPVPVLMG